MKNKKLHLLPMRDAFIKTLQKIAEKDKKVIYEPVKLEQNYRNFDFESPWEGTNYIKEIKNIDTDKNGKKN